MVDWIKEQMADDLAVGVILMSNHLEQQIKEADRAIRNWPAEESDGKVRLVWEVIQRLIVEIQDLQSFTDSILTRIGVGDDSTTLDAPRKAVEPRHGEESICPIVVDVERRTVRQHDEAEEHALTADQAKTLAFLAKSFPRLLATAVQLRAAIEMDSDLTVNEPARRLGEVCNQVGMLAKWVIRPGVPGRPKKMRGYGLQDFRKGPIVPRGEGDAT